MIAKPNDELRILIIDNVNYDTSATRDLLTRARYQSITSTRNVDNARKTLMSSPFDFILIDPLIPRSENDSEDWSTGIELVDDILASFTNCSVLILSRSATSFAVEEICRRKLGFVRKHDLIDAHLLDSAIQTTLSGGIVYSSTVIALIQTKFEILKKQMRPPGLSNREKQILYLFSVVFLNDEKRDEKVAKALQINPDTAVKHRMNAMETLGIHSSDELIIWVQKHLDEFEGINYQFSNLKREKGEKSKSKAIITNLQRDLNHRRLSVFLSHSSEDKSAVRELYQRLRKAGTDPWLDEEKLLPGQDWRKEIPGAVKNSDVVIVCLSQKSVNKAGYVQKEINDTLDMADQQPEGTIFVIPLRLEDCVVPERLSRWHWVDYFDEKGFDRLLQALKKRAESIMTKL